MKVRVYPLALPLEHEFTIARESISVQRSLIVELEHEGVCGYGEATENTYYGHSLKSMTAAIENCTPILHSYQFGRPQELWDMLQAGLSGDPFTLSALDLAAHDLHGKLKQQPTYQLLGLQWERIPASSYTIGIDSIDKMVAKLNEQPGWPVYKIKLGTEHDVDIVRQLREQTDATLRVDANCGWTAEETIANASVLKQLGVEFIEQPLPATAPDEAHRRVYAESVLPIIADESCLVESDVEKCHQRFHGVNVKLCKCGGLTPAVRMLREARSLGMSTMVGCMVESSIGISAAAQLLPLLDYADLDGAVLLADEPAEGATVQRGRVQLGPLDGNGARLIKQRLDAFAIQQA
ncbi:dipeptide epimerase [Roseimaritima ulvae]|uniref:Dipeptide epimerase n=1 Tax=Roseimaritima ulvae TaxID=980254 RepID=A0A5B9QPP3_9BACT|nr:dipeptide epimerase [Roseimaritima ulvae]QEG39485.1 L-Ala-D/L-Glu epimerase [Roseimaritima ulvae]